MSEPEAPPRSRARPAKNAITGDTADMLPRWLVAAWNTLSVVPTGRGSRNDRRVVYSTLLVVSCAYVLYATPQMLCKVQSKCDTSLYTVIEGIFPRVMSTTCLASRLIGLLGAGGSRVAAAAYERHLAAGRALKPVTRAEADALARFACGVVLAGALIILPSNVLRVWKLVSTDVPVPVTVAFGLMYAQNFSSFCVESHFATACHALCHTFAAVNRDLAAIKAHEVARNRYPAALNSRARTTADACPLRTTAHLRRLRTTHGLTAEAAVGLNRAFGIHLGLSLCALCLFFILDVYYNMLGMWFDRNGWDLMFICWIVQYISRFLLITVMAHVTAKQANESKILLTDINNRFLDKNTKEELQLFLNQIQSRTIHFTAGDFFTVNVHLVVSAVAVGITYLVILLQLNI